MALTDATCRYVNVRMFSVCWSSLFLAFLRVMWCDESLVLCSQEMCYAFSLVTDYASLTHIHAHTHTHSLSHTTHKYTQTIAWVVKRKWWSKWVRNGAIYRASVVVGCLCRSIGFYVAGTSSPSHIRAVCNISSDASVGLRIWQQGYAGYSECTILSVNHDIVLGSVHVKPRCIEATLNCRARQLPVPAVYHSSLCWYIPPKYMLVLFL